MNLVLVNNLPLQDVRKSICHSNKTDLQCVTVGAMPFVTDPLPC